MRLSDTQIDLYSRQILLRELGGAGQRRLLEASCVIAGAPSKTDTIATYLAGSGVGRIDLIRPRNAAASRASGFAPLLRRSPDAVVSVLEADREVHLAAYDVALLVLAGGLALEHVATQGRAKQGTIALQGGLAGRQELLLLPSAAGGCFACVRVASAAPPSRAGDDPLVTPAGAAMAALAALRWLGRIRQEESVRALVLTPGDATWRESEVDRLDRCPRGCRS